MPDPAPPPFEVVVVGNAGVDTNVYIDRDDLDPAAEGHFTRNVTYTAHAGGFAARGYASLGYRTAFLGALGDDADGDSVRSTFRREGIDTSGVFPDPEGTASSVNLVFRDGRRRNFYDGKGHMTLAPDLDAARAMLAGARLSHVNIPNWARLVVPIARELGVPVTCDVQDVASADDPYRRDVVRGADYPFFSAANLPEPDAVMREWWRERPDLVLIAGLGARGCALGVDGDIRTFAPPHSICRSSTPTAPAKRSPAVSWRAACSKGARWSNRSSVASSRPGTAAPSQVRKPAS